MSHWEDDLARTLASLHQATPPAGLESRILSRLQSAPNPSPARTPLLR